MSCQGNKILSNSHSDLLNKALTDHNVLFSVRKVLPGESLFKQFKLRYKPKEVVGFYTEIEHYNITKTTVPRKSGWFIQGPGNVFFSLSEEDFSEFFEILEEKEEE